MSNAKSVVVVVLVQRRITESSAVGGEIERDVKKRLEGSELSENFEVAHVRYLHNDPANAVAPAISEDDVEVN